MAGRIEEMRLVALCMLSDNREAFSRLVEMHQEGLRRFVFNLCSGDAALTDDICQETFLKAWLAIRSFRGLSGFKTWLYRIAINEHISYRRKYPAGVTTDLSDPQLTSIPLDGGQKALEANMDITVLLEQLSEAERAVTLLFYLEGMPIKEITKTTGMPEGTIKSHLSRARKHLALILDKESAPEVRNASSC